MSEPSDDEDARREAQEGDAPTRPPEAPEEEAAEDEDPALALPPPLIGKDPGVSSHTRALSRPASQTPAVSAPRGPSWFTLGVVGLGLVVVFALVLPSLLSVSVLRASALEGVRAVGGPDAGLVGASLSWTDGLALERVYLPTPQPGMPTVVLNELRLETNLVQGASGYLWGDTVVSKLVAKGGRIVFDSTGLASVDSANAAPAGSAEQAFALPFPLRPSLDLQGLDLEIRWRPGEVEPRRATFSGLRAQGGGLIGTDLALSLDDGLDFEADEVTVERLGEAGPSLLLGLSKARFATERLVVPAPAEFEAQAVDTRFAISAEEVRVGDVRLHDVSADLAFQRGQATLELAGRETRGALRYKAEHDMRDPQRWPSTIALALEGVDLSPELRARMPLLVPLLAATSSARGVGLPPLSLDLGVGLDVVFTPEGAFDVDATLASLAGEGTFRLGAGTLHASLLLDGYVRALLNVSVAPLTERLVPAVLQIKAAEGAFQVADGVVTLPRIVLEAEGLGLILEGQVRFDGTYELTVHPTFSGEALGPAQTLALAVDDAGGVTLVGSLLEGTAEGRLPPAAKILEAAQARGVLETLATSSGQLGGELRELLDEIK